MISYIKKFFNLKYINKKNKPKLLKKNINFKYKGNRVLNYCIKINTSSTYNFGDLDIDTIIFIKKMISTLPSSVSTKNRYCYITIDNKKVKKNNSQRTQGFHIDGLQGEEIINKKKGCFHLLWVSNLPTEYILNAKINKNINLKKYNFFNYLDTIKYKKIYQIEKKSIYLINSYLIHRSPISRKKCNRLFIRISFSEIPITSKKMTKNDSISYNYKIHTTSGNIDKRLK